jgi:hypothetical protein
MDGVFGAITKVTLAVFDPAEFVALIKKAVESKVNVGLPLITQVEL